MAAGSKISRDPLAIVGFACRLPGNSNNPTAFWKMMESGRIASIDPPKSRFRLAGHEDGSKKPKTMRSPGGMFLEDIHPADLDAEFFGLSRSEVIAMDPQQRQLLEVVYESLENAGITLEMLKGDSVGCFVGSFACDYGDMQSRNPDDRAPNTTVGIGRAMLSNRISHFLDIKGPSMTIDTACSGSLVSVDVAARYLQAEDINTAIVAGANIYLNPEHCIDLSGLSGAASLTGKCWTFDAKADGYVKAEAINTIIIKRLKDAIQAKDPIRAIIRGTASNSDGWTAGIASPSSEAQAEVTRRAYANAGITDYNSTSYLECHGTGTKTGDPAEVKGAASVFCTTRPTDKPLFIGSVKSNVGHSEPASGISGMIKTIMAMEKGVIPGNPTFSTPNPEIDFEKLRLSVSRDNRPWPDVPYRRASVNSFGFGGSNAHVILDEASTCSEPLRSLHKSSYLQQDSHDIFAEEKLEPLQLLVFSANDASSLRNYVRSLHNHLINPGVHVALQDLAYTLSERRSRHFNRAYSITRCAQFDVNNLVFGKPQTSVPRIGLVFTGQGAQWPQMGKSFLDTLPICRKVIRRLDKTLQSLKHPPSWSLEEEISQPRTREHLQRPEFCQPLITAFQLCVLEVILSWGIEPVSVVGHSSGEIAASVAAGRMSMDDAIIVAYLRGKAAAHIGKAPMFSHGMLAVGLDEHTARGILEKRNLPVAVACINSPRSITLSGEIENLQTLESELKDDGKFARLLQVDLAYHSRFIAHIAASYSALMSEESFNPTADTAENHQCKMFSSVTGAAFTGKCDAAYWKTNMESPVLFQQAVSALLSDQEPANFLIELGPSGALAGPLTQIKEFLGAQAADVTYRAVSKRHHSAVESLFETAGDLFLHGVQVQLTMVNQYLQNQPDLSTIVDLPNYSWNHAVKLWYENEASQDWRFQNYPNHDLLGSKVLGTSWHAPSWKKTLRVEEAGWLKDHRIGGQILFPAAGYIAMAVEAQFQMSQSRRFVNEDLCVHELSYKLRNVAFDKAMVLENNEARIELVLCPEDDSENSWSKFTVHSLVSNEWLCHCTGMIALADPKIAVASEHDMRPLEYPTNPQAWYKAMKEVGYDFGKSFRPMINIEAIAGSRTNRAHICFDIPESSYPQSQYSIHPVAIDGCLQAGAPSLWAGIRSEVNKALVPVMIDYLFINRRQQNVEKGVASSSAIFTGVGGKDDPQNYRSDIAVFDHNTRMELVHIKGIRYHKLEAHDDVGIMHNYMLLSWKPDVSYMTEDDFHSYFNPKAGVLSLPEREENSSVIDLLIHRNPVMKVLEISLLADSDSIWISNQASTGTYNTSWQYTLALSDTAAFYESQRKFKSNNNVQILHLDTSNGSWEQNDLSGDYDLVILAIPNELNSQLQTAISNTNSLLQEKGSILIHVSGSVRSIPNTSTETTTQDSPVQTTCFNSNTISFVLDEAGFKLDAMLPQNIVSRNRNALDYLATKSSHVSRTEIAPITTHILGLSDAPVDLELMQQIIAGYGFATYQIGIDSIHDISPESLVVVVDEIFEALLSKVEQTQWDAIKFLIKLNCRILWVTSGALLQVVHPSRSLIYGMSRVIRAENPSAKLTLLDIESVSSPQSLERIGKILYDVSRDCCSDFEYVERSGIVFTSRVLLDTPMNIAQQEDSEGEHLLVTNFHEHPSCIRMVCQSPGKLDTLKFEEAAEGELPLPEDFIEIDMHAAGVNYKDVATCLGIVPENQRMLGFEGSGTVRRLGCGPRAQKFSLNQRVVVYRRGSFGNRVQSPVDLVHTIPDWMSYEEASTLSAVYIAVIHGLFNMANIKKDHTVLIHSAAGGVGIAALEVCQHVGAKVFATVGSEKKRLHLMETYGLPKEHIFSSRDTRFAEQIMMITNNKGVDIILNSLTGELLDASWRIIADCGTMVELGKKDILGLKRLSMEPFNRNASFRAIDMSHHSITHELIAQLMSRMFELIENRHIKPIEPRTIFPYSAIGGAIRYMRAGTHMGKIVISRNADEKGKTISVQPSKRQLFFQPNKSYLLVGGLKGLCGSLAVYLARNGAKHIAVMARGDYSDERSKTVLRDLRSLGSNAILITGDVSKHADVSRAFQQISPPIGGIIQGAMVLRDKTYEAMTVDQFHASIACKVQGTWNLHTIACDQRLELSFFTMLSSISGIVGQKGQANYAAANAFLDSFASYRSSLSLPACSVDLGVIEDVGYISERAEVAARLNTAIWKPINEPLLHRILRASILQQSSRPINLRSASNMITGIPFPQSNDAPLLFDPRFHALRQAFCTEPQNLDNDEIGEIRNLIARVGSKEVDHRLLIPRVVRVMNDHFVKSLGLTDRMEPDKPLTVYGLDSLAAMELRNWLKKELKVHITILEIVGSKTLTALGEKVSSKLV